MPIHSSASSITERDHAVSQVLSARLVQCQDAVCHYAVKIFRMLPYNDPLSLLTTNN